MSISGKVIGYLGSVFSLYPRSGGGIVVRQPGGVAGTDQFEITHTGARTNLQSLDGSVRIYSTDTGQYFEVTAAGCYIGGVGLLDSAESNYRLDSSGIKLGSSKRFSFTQGATYEAIDVSIKRLAAGVLGLDNGTSTATWLQNSAARSRVNSNVTNTTITPAAITGLSHTLIAGRKYTGRLVLYAAVPTSADGIRIDFDGGTATMTSFVAQGILSDDTSTRKLARTTALATDITDTDLSGDGLITIELGFVCNAAGTFIPRVAKEADAAGATLTVLANSFLWLEDMP